MEHLKNRDLMEIIHYLAHFRDTCREKAKNNQSESVAKRNEAYADNADRLIELCAKEIKEA